MTSLTHNCKQCNAEYHTTRSGTNFCGQNCRTKWNRAQKKVESLTFINCAHCNTEFTSNKKVAKYCSPKCRQDWGNKQIQDAKREENNKLYEDVADIPTCKICGWKSAALHTHIRSHDLTVEEYKIQHNASYNEIYHSSYVDVRSERMTGENNPGYQHGGTMSSFSTACKQYEGLSEDAVQAAITEQIVKANQTKDANAGYNTRTDFYEIRHGLSEHEAKEAVSARQSTFSLEKCIEKFGEAVGLEVWKFRQVKWQSTLDALPDHIKRDIELRKAQNLRNGRGFSTISQQLFESLDIPDSAYGRNEVALISPTFKIFRVDFLLGNKVIEFNGDYWHANPSILKYADDNIEIKLPGNKVTTTKAIRDKDAFRISELRSMGYEVLVIWESDYRQNKQREIDKCLEFLKS